MRPSVRWGAVALASLAAVVSVNCGGGDNNQPSGKQATIDMAGVESGIDQVSALVPICQIGGSGTGPAMTAPEDVWLARLLGLRRDGLLQATFAIQALGPTQPADQLGDCGGRRTYTDYSHASGVTRGTLAFQNYCTTNTDTGDRTTVNGEISFVDTGTPSGSGPITTKVEADSPDGIRVETRTAGGVVTSSLNLRITDYLYQVGVPGGDPTAASPDRISAKEMRLTNLSTGKVYRHTSYNATLFTTPSGGEQASVSGRSYRSDGNWFQVATTAPLVSNTDGDVLGGALAFSGAANSTATLTLVPGAILQATMTVNGTPVTSVPACQ